MQDLLARMSSFTSKTNSVPIDEIARRTGFVRRSARKAEARQWLQAICLMSTLPSRSFRILAWLLGLLKGQSHSKQNVGKRIHNCFEQFLQEVLTEIIAKLARQTQHVDPALKTFGRVIVQDSTVIGLPARLADRFPGAKNQTGKAVAGMRIQAFFDLLSESCLGFSISPFTRNDQLASGDVLKLARPGDLIIRDLGYSSLSLFLRLIKEGVHFLSRLKYGTCVFDHNGHPVDLLALLQRQRHLDMQAYVGKETRLPVRLIAVPVPEVVAAQRRRKARSNRDRRTNPSKKHMRLLGWTILITSVAQEQIELCALVKTYGLRWRIETLFKTWKSHFRFGSVPAYACSTFVCSLILAGLIYVAMFQTLFQDLRCRDKGKQPHLSPMKLASIIHNCAFIELQTIITSIDSQKFWYTMIYHCRYDQRKRTNYYQVLENLALG
ncbi:MAG: IS4 family transposase [Opitutales bacterium]|nr:IS4 family transposase [Opitutales bacterium]MCH8541641.1 IS4 family transposase [Opitutales bacterium]